MQSDINYSYQTLNELPHDKTYMSVCWFCHEAAQILFVSLVSDKAIWLKFPASSQSDQSLRCPHEESLGPYPLSAQRRLRSDWADAQADLSLHWVHMSVCWFCHEAAQILFVSLVSDKAI